LHIAAQPRPVAVDRFVHKLGEPMRNRSAIQFTGAAFLAIAALRIDPNQSPSISASDCLRLPGRRGAFFGLKQGMLLFQFLPLN
jgi:hypothetical protein